MLKYQNHTKKLIAFAIGLFLLFGCSSEKLANDEVAFETPLVQNIEELNSIRNIMIDQEIAWNSGSLEGFMQAYWNSEDLSFIGSRGLQKGWQRTLDNYKKSYPDKETMGILKFDILEMKMIDSDNAFVIGKWQLQRKEQDIDGHFSLWWKKINQEWLIVADHSS
ncbi:MAG: DUF4440 domain-containing protein [Flavobacteriales bacterium]|nr:DUF4440 domain-containing protein [Flavobacteriales bacterium]MDG1767711.1 DUF4440 domain-containing protein [Flavobacteriales bacterium]